MAQYLERSTAIDIAISAEDVHPYKVAGQPETYSDYNQGWSDACGYISELFETAPTIDVLAVTSDNLVGSGATELVPMLRGKWILRHIGCVHFFECSVCHATPIYGTKNTKFCQNCGARMDEEDDSSDPDLVD